MTDDHERHYQQAAKEILAPAFKWWADDVIDNATLMALMSRMIGAQVYDPALRGMVQGLGQGSAENQVAPFAPGEGGRRQVVQPKAK